MVEFDSVFISHRSFDYSKAERLQRFLLDNQISKKVILLKNETLCRNYEQLTVHEYFEAIEKIKEEMAKCNFFFYLDCPNYTNGYFTSAELLQWRSIKNNAVIYPIQECEDGTFRYAQLPQPALTKNQRRSLSFTAFSMRYDPEYGYAPESWGKYANNCFLVGCCVCGKYHLITKRRMDKYIKTQEIAQCPYCDIKYATFYQCQSGRKFFSNRFPIIMRPNVKKVADLLQLGVNDVIELLDAKELPEHFALLSMPNEKLQSDFKNKMKSFAETTTGIAGGIAVLYTLFKIFDRKDEE